MQDTGAKRGYTELTENLLFVFSQRSLCLLSALCVPQTV